VIILAVYFIHKRFWPELAILLIGSGGGALIWSVLIGIFNRPRPTNQIGIVVTDPSFPSGHTISAVICYGLLAYLLVPKMPSLFWKWVVVLASILIMAFIGYSRLFLGGHYLTDIVAGYGLGLAWAGLVITLIERFFLRRKTSPDR
jgi:membrane-associated phospholipid phosphatase